MSQKPVPRRRCRRERACIPDAIATANDVLKRVFSAWVQPAAVLLSAFPQSRLIRPSCVCLVLFTLLQVESFAQRQGEFHALLYESSSSSVTKSHEADFLNIDKTWAKRSTEWIWLSVFENNQWFLRRVSIEQTPAIDQSYTSPGRITTLCKRSPQEYWVGTSGHGLFHVEDDQLVPLKIEPEIESLGSALTSDSSVVDICSHSNGKAYVATSDGIYVVNNVDGALQASKLSDLVTRSIVEYTDRKLVCMTKKDVQLLDPDNGDVAAEVWLADDKPGHKPTVVKLANDGTLWIGTNQGLYVLEDEIARPFEPRNLDSLLRGKGIIDIAESPAQQTDLLNSNDSRFLFVMTESELVYVDRKSHYHSSVPVPLLVTPHEILPRLVCSKDDVWISSSIGLSHCTKLRRQAVHVGLQDSVVNDDLYLTTDQSSTRLNLDSATPSAASRFRYRVLSTDDEKLSGSWHNTNDNLDLLTPRPGNYELQFASFEQGVGQSPISSVEYHVAYPSIRWLRNIIVSFTSAACAIFGFMFVTGIIRTNRELERCVEVRTAEALSAHQEKQQLEFNLLHAQKMESLGTMAAGMAHDFNNSLCAITSNAELGLLSLYQSPDRVQKYLEDVLEASHQASDITQSLLTFAGKSPPKKQAGQLQHVVENSMRMIRSAVPASIGITSIFDEPIWCQLDSAQMNQVIVNLTMNARDAMPDGGDLTIEVFQDITTNDRRNAVLRISDTGKGMDEATLSRVFEPFYTTKARGKGTGLGMSMVHSIVSAHDGIINVESEVDYGTVVELRFPTCAPEIGSDIHSGTLNQTPQKKLTGTVLIADDEPRVRSSLASVFEMAGLRVITAKDGSQLVENANKNSGEIMLIATDLDMPGLDGASAVQSIRSKHPDMPAIIFTGQATFPRELDPNITAYLRKPFQLAEILDAARKLAGQTDSHADA